MEILLFLLICIPGILLATTTHEFTRAAVSTKLGDYIPKEKGRLTINPFNHFEPIGFILMLSTGFGWGKPVETSSLYYKNRKQDMLKVAIAPSLANLLMALIFTVFYKIFLNINFPFATVLVTVISKCVYFNISLAIYNIVPISPMDGLKIMSHIIPANQYFKYLQYEKIAQVLFLIFLFMGFVTGFFNVIIYFIMYVFRMAIFFI